MGKKKDNELWRSYKIFVKDIVVQNDSNEKFIADINFLIDFLTTELYKLVHNPTFISYAEANLHLSRGEFWNLITKTYYPHHQWKLNGNKAKYWRIILERIRVTLLSLEERKKIASICATYNFDDQYFQQIKDDCYTQNIYPSWQTIKNILKSKAMPSFPKELQAQLDYTVGDAQIIKSNGELDFWIEIPTDSTKNETPSQYNISIPKSSSLRGKPLKYAKPVIQLTDEGIPYCRMAYLFPKPEELKGICVMGVDLGKIKAFTAAVLYGDGSYSTELMPSRETENLNRKVNNLTEQIENLSRKIDTQNKKLSIREPELWNDHQKDLVWKLKSLYDVRSNLISKRTRMKKQLARLVARDVVNHALECKASVIRLEDLKFVTDVGGRWHYAEVQNCILEAAELVGILVEIVDAKDSSRTNPFTDEKISYNAKTRSLEIAKGFFLDRDFGASIELARRFPNKSKRNKKSKPAQQTRPEKMVVKQSSCRDKFGPTPKRPKSLSNKRKRSLGLNKKKVVYSSNRVRLNRANCGGLTFLSPVALAKKTRTLYSSSFNYDRVIRSG